MKSFEIKKKWLSEESCHKNTLKCHGYVGNKGKTEKIK